MKILLHACCAPCSIECIDALAQEHIQPDLFWYNPNIHPVSEYRARRDALIDYAGRRGLPLIHEDEYGLRRFVSAVHPHYDQRCGFCYYDRLERTAQYAAQNDYEGFCTTLLISPYQDQARILAIGEELEQAYGIPFLVRDFRPRFRQGQQRARDLQLYMQKYCGCIFSEEERYLPSR